MLHVFPNNYLVGQMGTITPDSGVMVPICPTVYFFFSISLFRTENTPTQHFPKVLGAPLVGEKKKSSFNSFFLTPTT